MNIHALLQNTLNHQSPGTSRRQKCRTLNSATQTVISISIRQNSPTFRNDDMKVQNKNEFPSVLHSGFSPYSQPCLGPDLMGVKGFGVCTVGGKKKRKSSESGTPEASWWSIRRCCGLNPAAEKQRHRRAADARGRSWASTRTLLRMRTTLEAEERCRVRLEKTVGGV